MKNNKSKPLISVIIPTYNRALFLAESIDSVLAQDFSQFEVIVIDDGSTDNTQEILASYGKSITYVYQPNAGVSAATNKGIKLASASLIALHDSDDIMLHGRLKVQHEFMEAHPEVGAVTGNIIIQGNEEINYLEKSGVDFNGRESVICETPFPKMLLKNFMANAASMVRKECFLKVGMYDESLPIGQDTEFWLRVAKFWPLACLNKPCTWVRRHNENITLDRRSLECKIRIIGQNLENTKSIPAGITKDVERRLFWLFVDYINSNLKTDQKGNYEIFVGEYKKYLPWYYKLFIKIIIHSSKFYRKILFK